MTLSCRVLHLHWCRASTLFEMPHKMGKHLAIDMLAQTPRVESSDTPAVLPRIWLQLQWARMAVGQFFRVPFSFAASLFPGDTRLVSRGINFEFRSTQVKRFQRTWQVGEDSLFQASTSIIPNPCDKWHLLPPKNLWFEILPLVVGSVIVLFPFLNFWLNYWTLAPTGRFWDLKNCYDFCHGHRAPLIWRSHPWGGSAGLLGHIQVWGWLPVTAHLYGPGGFIVCFIT